MAVNPGEFNPMINVNVSNTSFGTSIVLTVAGHNLKSWEIPATCTDTSAFVME